MGSSGKTGKAHWLERLEAIKNFLIERIIEYRTIGDLLAMRDGIELRPEEEKKPSEDLEGPK